MNLSTKYRLVLLFVFLLSGGNKAHAQWLPCLDSNRLNPFYQCYQAYFSPVCGCDLKTYRNECIAFNGYGVNTVLHVGVCQNDFFAFDAYPNPASYRINWALEMAEMGAITIEVWDSFGKIMFTRNYASIRRIDDYLDLGNFRPGVYLFVLRGVNKIDYMKFIKSDR